MTPNQKPHLTAIILTKDEEKHIARAIGSLDGIADSILVVDSGSTDRTLEIAQSLGAETTFNPWVNYATQFNWALDQLTAEQTDWVFRLDADEYVTPELSSTIKAKLANLAEKTDGVMIGRRMTFLGRPMRYGGLFPVKVLRIFRNGKGRCEERWMDEHIKVDGASVDWTDEIIDDNHNSLTWWTNKHNSYASREVVDILNVEIGFMSHDTVASLSEGEPGLKRWIKEKIYQRLPSGLRAFGYFFYRYVIRLGFLDGREGLAFHALQGFWYRFLIDTKLYEVRSYMKKHNADPRSAILAVLDIDLPAKETS